MIIWNLKDFGVVGDGVTDDTEALKAACNSGYIELLARRSMTMAITVADILPKLYGPYRVVRKWKGRTFVVWRGR